MTTIDLETTTAKTAHHTATLVYGNVTLEPHPALAGHYSVFEMEQDGSKRFLSYLEVEPMQADGKVRLTRINSAIDKILAPRTVKA
jgi:hypothetical protein